MNTQQRTRRNLISRACDRCKARKSKCSGAQPCQQCMKAAAFCSYLVCQRMRGPPKNWTKTRASGRTATGDGTPLESQPIPTANPPPIAPFFRPRIATSALNPILALYQTSMYSVWPIVDADDLVSRLDDKGDLYNYALALATAAATLGQLKASASLPGQCPPADLCEAECQRVRYVLQCRDDEPNITWLRVAFFLHAYHENRLRGCTKSLLYLREAISLAHLMDLHGESLDQHIPIDQLCLRKRMFWLLFVTERGNSVFHRLPVQLLPVTQPLSDDIAPDSGGFEPLEIITRIFMAIDRSGLCYTSSKARQNSNEIMDRLGAFDCTLSWALSSLQNVNDIHKADVFVTVCWARVLLWKATQPAVNDVQAAWNWWVSPPCYLLNAAEEMISSLQALSSGSIGAHGVGIQVKIFDIASALIEHTFGVSYTNDGLSVPTDNRSLVALKKLHDILATIKNGHQKIISRLFEQVIDATSHGLTAPISFTWKTWKHIWDRVDDPAIMDGTNLSEFTSNLQSRALGVGPLEQIEMEWDNHVAITEGLAVGQGLEESFDSHHDHV